MNAACPEIAQAPLLRLRAGEVHAVAPGDAALIRCLGGAVWVTQAGLGEDIVLASGESFHPRAFGKIVVQALDDSVVEIQ